VLSSPWMASALRYLPPSMAAALAFAVVTSVLFYRARRNYLRVPSLPRVPPGKTPPDCMVVIPARNEEGVVGGAVKSFPHDTVIVVDDGSTDKTADEAREAGAGVLEAPPLKGALGKANACIAGARILTSRWILFADADTRYQEGFLDSVMGEAYQSEVFFLSVHLTPRPESLAEHLLEPYTEALLFSSSRLQREPALLFEGKCIVVLREAYEFIGGHTAIAKFLAEDLHLAMLARRHNMGIAVVRAAGLGNARTYAGWKGAWRWIERKTFRFVHMDPRITVKIMLTALSAALWLPLATWLWFTGHRIAPFVLTLLVVLQLLPWYGNRLRGLLAPVAVYAALPFLLHGLMTAFFGKQIVWKGRKVTPA
jgi:cellulose synthase/poly-beta-1,6-N-acetylglucosamine synthase-like glycosyltransferase